MKVVLLFEMEVGEAKSKCEAHVSAWDVAGSSYVHQPCAFESLLGLLGGGFFEVLCIEQAYCILVSDAYFFHQ